MANFTCKDGKGEAGAVGFQAFDHESLDDLKDALRDEAAVREVGFVFRQGSPFTVLEAVECVVSVLAERDGEVVLVFNTDTARSQAARVLPSGDQPRLEFMLGARRVEVRLGRIERASADVIVNASNTQLRLGSGVSGAIKKEASNPAALQAAMYAHAPIGEGQLVVTDSWLPNTPRIFHVATASGGAQAVRAALRAVLEGCARHGVDHLATPALGTGTGGLSMSTFGQLAREVVEAHQAERPTHLTFVLYSAGEFADFTAGFGPPTA